MGTYTEIGVVGCGIMGAGIAECCARAGCAVVVREVDDEALEAGRARVERSVDRAVRAEKLDDDGRRAVMSRLRFTTELQDLAGCDLVIEAVAESRPLKREIFASLDALLAPDALLTSNTSSIPIAELAAATARPGAVIGLHFFNPAPVLRLVEVVPSVLTDEATLRAVEEFAREVLGKVVIRSADRAGFVVNALLIPYLLAAIRMVEGGVATAADVDAGMELGCAQPMGPLRLADFIGLDTVAAIAESLREEFAETLYAPPPLLRRMVSAGLLGRKTGRGFYDYRAHP